MKEWEKLTWHDILLFSRECKPAVMRRCVNVIHLRVIVRYLRHIAWQPLQRSPEYESPGFTARPVDCRGLIVRMPESVRCALVLGTGRGTRETRLLEPAGRRRINQSTSEFIMRDGSMVRVSRRKAGLRMRASGVCFVS